ncbi:hypothetical protein [Leucobacter komagatae]|uniref:Uncharacterized protein n=1 Tax=Leucobacter komagatae TaxID=55969 RepID=A0A0D0H3U6_9MICO|nr:hypothetical protein [Leucobacter komagatae]KIP51850.1 hypothetical protein SD72_13030 [Leucobacter komagatae]
MKPLEAKTLSAVVGITVLTFLLFTGSAAMLGPWWRFTDMPAADEWTAFWSFATLLTAITAAWFALHQLFAMRTANTEAANAARDASDASRAVVRPYLDIRFEFIPSIPGNPQSTPSAGFTAVVIENLGKTAAKNIRLTSRPLFQSSGVGRTGDKDKALEWIQEKFSGSFVFEHLSPGKKLSYVLDLTKEQMDLERGLPQRYDVDAEYWDINSVEKYVETHVLDAAPWHLSRVDAEPLAVIARQMRTMNNYERTAQRLRSRLVNAAEEASEAIESLAAEVSETQQNSAGLPAEE